MDFKTAKTLGDARLSRVSACARARAAFVWGKSDCALFAADGILAVTGVDIADDFRGKYATEAEAMALIKSVCNGATVADAAVCARKKHGLEEWVDKKGKPRPLMARRGDLVVFNAPTGSMVAGLVHLSGQIVAQGEKGVYLFPISKALRAAGTMSKALQATFGAAEIAGGAALAIFTGGTAAALGVALIAAGVTTEAGVIAQALGSKSGLGITTRTPAALRQIIRGVQRVGGTIVYCSTTGSTNRQYNMIIALATHEIESIENLYLDGRQVYWKVGGSGIGDECNVTFPDGINFGGNADGNNHTGQNGDQYNFGGLVFCEAFRGNQTSSPSVTGGVLNPTGGYCTALNANDPTWAPSTGVVGQTAQGTATQGGGAVTLLGLSNPGEGYADGPVGVSIDDATGPGTGASATAVASGGRIISLTRVSGGHGYVDPVVTFDPPATVSNIPYLAGCAYVYLKIEADAGTFPEFPEIRFTIHGKNDIWDPRTSTRGFTTNWALHVADVISDPTWGLGDVSVNQDQLIAAANVCDEQVVCAAGEEAQYSLHMHYDTSTAPGDVLDQMMTAAAGRLSRIGGEWYIWPAYFQGSSFTFDENSLLDKVQWEGRKPLSELCNRVTGTYIAPTFPYNLAGNLYDSNGYFNGVTQNNFPFSFQPTNYPMYAADALHGYGEDVYLIADTPNQGSWSSGPAYAAAAVVIYGGVPWQAN